MTPAPPTLRRGGLIFTYPDGRTEKLRDMGGYFLNERGERVSNPTGGPGIHITVVPPFLDERER